MRGAMLMSCLVISLVMAGLASASIVDHSGLIIAHDRNWVLMSSGEAFFMDVDTSGRTAVWQPAENCVPPIPVAEIKFWMIDRAIATNGDAWVRFGGPVEWVNLGPPPGGAVQSDQSTWGKLKSKFKGE